MRRKLATCAVCLCVLLSQGCAYRYKYKTDIPPTGDRITLWRHHLAWGWSNPEAVYLDEVSPAGVSEFGSYISFTNWLCTFFTLGFYSPQMVYVIPGDGFVGDSPEEEGES